MIKPTWISPFELLEESMMITMTMVIDDDECDDGDHYDNDVPD